jgi:hypothetical protein
MKCITFRDLSVEKKQGYELAPIESNSLVVKEMILPAVQGFPPMYIRHIRVFHGEPILIISQTDYELSDAKKAEIVSGAIKFLSA